MIPIVLKAALYGVRTAKKRTTVTFKTKDGKTVSFKAILTSKRKTQ